MLPAEPTPLNEQTKYQYVSTLGKGAFGFVQLAKNTHIESQELVAIKFLRRTDVNKYVEAEIVNHSLLRHPHVIHFKEVFLTRQYICIVMELASGGSLFHYVQKQGRLKEAVARWFFQQLMVGVDYCHKRGVANRDIKLENTLLQIVPKLPLPLLKICDFGYSKADFKSAAKSKVGTLTYMAPEVLNPSRDGKYDGKVADIWSCGVMLYVMLCGRYPFESPPSSSSQSHELFSMLDKMLGQKYVIPEQLGISADCSDLLRRMLLPSPSARIKLEEITQHPWFRANLPPEATSMNSTYLSAPPNQQSIDHTRRVIEEARRSPFNTHKLASSGQGGMEIDGEDSIQKVIDAAISEQMRTGQAPSAEVVQYMQEQRSKQA